MGLLEIVIILAIVLLLFGASRLPQLGTALGRTVQAFKSGRANRRDIEVQPDQDPGESER